MSLSPYAYNSYLCRGGWRVEARAGSSWFDLIWIVLIFPSKKGGRGRDLGERKKKGTTLDGRGAGRRGREEFGRGNNAHRGRARSAAAAALSLSLAAVYMSLRVEAPRRTALAGGLA